MYHKDVNLIQHTNLNDFTMTACMLVREGFGSFKEIEALDTDDFLDMVEFLQISRAIEKHQINEARTNGGS